MQPEIKKIADEIELYVHDNPNSADTLDGIMRWWLTGRDPTRANVAAALDYLVSEKKSCISGVRMGISIMPFRPRPIEGRQYFNCRFVHRY